MAKYCRKACSIWNLRSVHSFPRILRTTVTPRHMTTRYITERTTYLYKDSTSGKRTSPGLIYGDEVEADKKSNNGRLKVKFRDFEGYVAEDHLGDSPVMEMYFIDVGQGDSTFIVTPSRKKILIDGGANKRAYGFLSWKYRLDKDGDPIDIDLLILSHADGDHIDGLVPIIKHPKIMVHRIVHNGIATFEKDVLATELGDLDKSKTYLVTRHSGVDELDDSKISKPFKAWKDSIIEKGVACEAVDSTTGTLDIGDPDVRIEVLGPRLDSLNGKNCYKWFDEKPITINGHSVVLRMNWKYISVLLPDDINTKGAAHLLGDPGIIAKMNAHVFKAPHHGSKDFSRSFLEAVRPQIPIISSGDEPDYGHPRAECIGALGQLSRSTKPLVFSTEIAATFAEDKKDIQKETEKNKEDEATVEKSDLGKPNSSAVARRIFKRILNGMINSAPTVVRYTLPGG